MAVSNRIIRIIFGHILYLTLVPWLLRMLEFDLYEQYCGPSSNIIPSINGIQSGIQDI